MKVPSLFTISALALIVVAVCSRLFFLGNFPAGLNQDEAVNGYDAFAIGQTARDHHGHFLPLMFESFHDWSSPLLTYLTVPFIWLFGLSIWSVRLPAALLGIGTIGWIFLLSKQLTNSKWFGLAAAAFVTFSGWHLFFSRWAIPAAAVQFLSCGLFWFMLKIVEQSDAQQRTVAKNSIHFFSLRNLLLLGSLFATALTYSYGTQKLYAPLIVGITTFWLWRFRPTLRRTLPWFVVPYVLLCGVFLWINIAPGNIYNSRFEELSVTRQRQPVTLFVTQYFQYFSRQFLFGGEGQFSDPQMTGSAIFPIVFVVPLVVGGYLVLENGSQFLTQKKSTKKLLSQTQLSSLLVVSWLLLAPIPAALTFDELHIIRTLHLLPLLICVAIIGLQKISELLRARFSLAVATWVIVGIYLLLGLRFANYIHHFTTDYRLQLISYFNTGVETSIPLMKNLPECKQWVMSSTINQAYIYYLFFSQREPDADLYKAIADRSTQVDNVTFRPILPLNLQGARLIEKSGLVGRPINVYISADGSCLISKDY